MDLFEETIRLAANGPVPKPRVQIRADLATYLGLIEPVAGVSFITLTNVELDKAVLFKVLDLFKQGETDES